jgi:hypothetical protein
VKTARLPAKSRDNDGCRLDESGQFRGQRGFEAEFLVRDRMRKTKDPGMEAEAFDRVGLGAVFGVADDRAAGIGEVEPDLMAAASLESQFHEGAAFVPIQDAVMGGRVPGGRAAGDAEDLDGARLVYFFPIFTLAHRALAAAASFARCAAEILRFFLFGAAAVAAAGCPALTFAQRAR